MWRRVWVWERRLKKGKTYCLRWHDDEGRVRSETVGSDRKLAERLRGEREHGLNAGTLHEPRRISYGEFVAEELILMRSRLAPSSLEGLEFTLRSFGELAGDRALAAITPGLVERYFAQRLERVRLATANKSLRTLRAAFNRAVQRGYLSENPADGLKPVREPEREVRVLTPEEIGKLLEASPSERWRALIALAVTTGMRLGEMVALRWRDVELDEGTLWVRNTPQHLTKSRRNRVLSLAPEVCELLKRLPSRPEFVFHTRDGNPWRNNVQTGFRRIVKRAGIRYCTLHDLRRTFVSQLAMAGVNEAVVQKLAGHASINTTLRYYTRIMPDALRTAQARLPYMDVVSDVSDTYHGRIRGPQAGEA